MGVLGCGDSLRRELPVHLATFLYYMGENMIIMTALPYITYGVCRDVFPNMTSDFCLNINEHPEEEYRVQIFNASSFCQKTSALYVMAEKMMGTIPPLLLAAFFGPWSDVHGRKLPLLIPYVGNIVSVALFLAALYVENTPVTLFIMAGFLVRALSGHFILVHLVSFSYVADVIKAGGTYEEIGIASRSVGKKRGKGKGDSGSFEEIGSGGYRRVAVEVAGEGERRDQGDFLAGMTRLQAAESVGIVVGALMGWALQTVGGAPTSLCVGAAVLVLGMLVVVFCMKNYHRPGAGSLGDGESSALVKCLKKTAKVLGCKRLDVDPVVMWGCLLVMFFMFACREGRGAVSTVYVQLPPLSWPYRRFAAYITSYSAFQSVFLFLLAPFLKDRTVVVVGLVCTAVGGVWLGFSTTTWSFMLAGSLSHMIDCVFPALRAILVSRLSQDQVGEVLSRMSAAEALSTVVGPLAIVQLYNHTVDYFPGLAFVASSALPLAILLVGAVVEAFYQPRVRHVIREFQVPELGARDGSRKPDFTQSLNVPSATVSGYGLFWCSAQW